MSLQVLRQTDTRWNVTRVTRVWDEGKGNKEACFEYEAVGRLIYEAGRYYAERAVFVEDGIEYERGLAIGRVLMVGALMDLVKEKTINEAG